MLRRSAARQATDDPAAESSLARQRVVYYESAHLP